MNTANSKQTVWVDTSVHRCTVMEDTTSYSEQTLSQGRDSQVKVPRFSMLAGEPPRTEEDDAYRAVFWQSYIAAVALTLVCVVILAYWPN